MSTVYGSCQTLCSIGYPLEASSALAALARPDRSGSARDRAGRDPRPHGPALSEGSRRSHSTTRQGRPRSAAGPSAAAGGLTPRWAGHRGARGASAGRAPRHQEEQPGSGPRHPIVSVHRALRSSSEVRMEVQPCPDRSCSRARRAQHRERGHRAQTDGGRIRVRAGSHRLETSISLSVPSVW